MKYDWNRHTLGVREENDPVVANELVELDVALLQKKFS